MLAYLSKATISLMPLVGTWCAALAAQKKRKETEREGKCPCLLARFVGTFGTLSHPLVLPSPAQSAQSAHPACPGLGSKKLGRLGKACVFFPHPPCVGSMVVL